MRKYRINFSSDILKPTIFLDQIFNSILSFMIIREIISVSSFTLISNFNTLIVLSYAYVTISRLFLQNFVSKGSLNFKTVCQKIFQSNFLRLIFVLVILFIFIGLNNMNNLVALLLFLSIASMDFTRYYYLFTGRTIPSLIGNSVSIFLGFFMLVWIVRPNAKSENVILIWTILNCIYIACTVLISRIPIYRIPSELFIDTGFTLNFRYILIDSAGLQFFQTLSSVCLFYFAPEANAAARIGSQVFLSVPNLLIAATAPFIALYVSKGLISYKSRFNLMLLQLLYFFLPFPLIFLPKIVLEILSGSSDRYYLIYQLGFISIGMTFFVISSFSYGYIQLVGARNFFIMKFVLLFCSLFFPLLSLVFSGVLLFNSIAIVALCIAILALKKMLTSKR